MSLTKIPYHIIQSHIIPYTYNTQPYELLNDIINYVFIKNILKKTYKNINNGTESLLHDLINFFNNHQNTMSEPYECQYYQKYRRLFKLKHVSRNHLFFFLYLKIPCYDITRIINIKIGILKPEERYEFLNQYK
jgi:hypothetical protein